jgi:hypothetical protein
VDCHRQRSADDGEHDGRWGDALVLDSQRSVTRQAKLCPNRRIGLRASDGRKLAPISCKRRDCQVCGPRKARELARVLVLDARQEAPTHAMTLTSALPWDQLDPAVFREGTAAVLKRLRRRYGRVEYFSAVEFTTGLAERSGGERRMHSHNLLKFRDASDVDVIDVERLVRETWRATTGAYVVEVAALISPGAALGYLALHHRKPEQAAPAGWRGMVERHSQGYFVRSIGELRQEARVELQAEAIAWAKGLPFELAALEVAATDWSVVRVYERANSPLIEPLGPLERNNVSGSDWTTRRGQLVHRHTGEVWLSKRVCVEQEVLKAGSGLGVPPWPTPL